MILGESNSQISRHLAEAQIKIKLILAGAILNKLSYA
jgi:hypothetical protein